MAIRCHDQSPMLVIPTGVVEKHGLGMMEQQDPAQHIAVAEVPDAFGMASRISHGQSKVMISVTYVLCHTRLGAGKYKNS